jgi:hypothetical protein
MNLYSIRPAAGGLRGNLFRSADGDATGSAGIEVAVNQVVRDAWLKMLLYIYGTVSILCLIAFRSWRAVLVALLPLALTSVLCEALMVWLGIGVKVATLPVIALGALILIPSLSNFLLPTSAVHKPAAAQATVP